MSFKPWSFTIQASLFLALSGCKGAQSMFSARGPQAQDIIKLWWILFAICALVFLIVSAFTLVAAFRRRTEDEEPLSSEKKLGKGLLYGIGATVGLLLVIIVSTFQLSQPLKSETSSLPISVEIIGKMWWWEVVYYDAKGEEFFRSANEIFLPRGVTSRLRLLSDSVIHSFWVPGLAGKMDMVPGRANTLSLRPLENGTYRGQCAEFCGIQHALMAFHVHVVEPGDYDSWKREQSRPYSRPTDQLAIRGADIFKKSCLGCHSVKGLGMASSNDEYGPDLTHFMSRSHLAAGSLLNKRGHLMGWISDPQASKPGSKMPATKLGSSDFKALMAFLEGLK